MTKHKPTARKLRKAREEGNVPKSLELVFALIFTGALLLLWGLKNFLGRGLSQVYTSIFTEFTLRPILVPWICILVGLCIIAFAGHYIQVGWLWAPKALAWKWRKRKGGFRPLLFLIKTAAVMTVGYLVVKTTRPTQTLIFGEPQTQVELLFKQLFSFGLSLAIVLMIIGIVDFFYQRWRFEKKMEMTPEELKQERRETDGDPELKSQMRQRD